MREQTRYKLGIISDTHGLLRQEVIHYLQGCDYILHGGDINKPEIIEQLKGIAPLYVVRGNNDKGEWAEALPHELYFKIGKWPIYMIHNKKEISSKAQEAKLIIYGHSHQCEMQEVDGRIYLNPGSCGKRRFSLPITMVIANLEENHIVVQDIVLNALEK